MTKIDIFSGFLGAGKTTLIKKLISEAYEGEKLVLIENEFGEIGIDGGFLEEAGIEITEMNSGCICCSLVGNFSEALKKVLDEYSPDRVIIEPSGVGKLSDVIKAVKDIGSDDIVLNSFTTVADATKCKMYMKNFGEFYNNQIENANAIILSRTDGLNQEKLDDAVALIREHNDHAVVITTPWNLLDGTAILDAMEHRDTLRTDIEKLEHEHKHHHSHDEQCECHHHHHDHDEECECHHHHHDHDDECECHHHHDHDEECECHHHHHDHGHDHHHADEIFTSCGAETTKRFTKTEIHDILSALDNQETFGIILRAKGIVDSGEGEWIHFDYVPGEIDIRNGKAAVIGRVCVIGSKIDENRVRELFGI